MNTGKTLEINSTSYADTLSVGEKLGRRLAGDEVIELISDLGGGKTALVRGLAKGIKSKDRVQSPSFTISRIYRGDKHEIHHFDFHRLDNPGIVAEQLAESIIQPNVVTVIEWSDVVAAVLPIERLQIQIAITGDETRQIHIKAVGSRHQKLLESLK